jgi:hypothetical protein
MLRRLWFVIAFGWAACCLWGGLDRPEGLMGKDVFIAFLPLGVIWIARFVLFGLPRPR